MSTEIALLLLFAVALAFSMILTPMAKWFGLRLGAVDIPKDRKVHTIPTPRIGGLAVFLAFSITFVLGDLYLTPVSDVFVINQQRIFAYFGGLILLSCGLWDDFRRLNPWIKLFFQIAGVTVAFMGGLSISGFHLDGFSVRFGILASYVITVFWFLLFINAVNLIDGLDGLAGGIVFFTSILMAVLSYMHGDYLTAFYFSALGGAILGFLKHNFNPASIFLGDSGSYFLGYVVAALAISSSMKSQVSALMLIPLLALGVPIFDTLVSPIRRFIRGRDVFQPDKGHIHHLFLRMGLSTQRVVMIIYGITLLLCVASIALVMYRGEGIAAILMLFLLIGAFFFVRKLGYMEYLAVDKLYGWFQDITDVAGFTNQRRSFLSLQIDAGKTRSVEELWAIIGNALTMIKFDRAELRLGTEEVYYWDRNKEGVLLNAGSQPAIQKSDESSGNLLRIDIPLNDDIKDVSARIILLKKVENGQLHPFTLRRVEHLRRTLLDNIKRLSK
jgi:UDP-GlcNAc:undecaprenyl-phosphate GlcNAc-1-phosphate transferase